MTCSVAAVDNSSVPLETFFHQLPTLRDYGNTVPRRPSDAQPRSDARPLATRGFGGRPSPVAAQLLPPGRKIDGGRHARPRRGPVALEQERRALGESWFRQEYCCSFEVLSGVVYPDFARCVVPSLLADLAALAPSVGGIDFGFRNPFAAVWGILDRDRVLWLTGEHYLREKHLSFHAERLPQRVTWYADPAGAGDIAQLASAGFTIHRGDNDIRLGIAAVRARLENGTLRVLQGACPNLLAEAGLYRYVTETGDVRSETPVDEHNHALGALRYLISKLDARLLARFRNRAGGEQPAPDTRAPDTAADRERPANKWLRYSNEELWTRWF
jgi:hypothetical protein